ncbi:MAG: hypothetical protein ACFE0Q_12880 [Anaerolineae bacterium]
MLRYWLTCALITLMLVPIYAQDGDKTLPGEGQLDPTDPARLSEPDVIADMLTQSETLALDVEFLLLNVDFSDEDDWEFYEDDTRSVRVDDGMYIAEVEGNSVIWGQNTDVLDDVLIGVQVTHVGESEDNGYGVMCRANVENNLEGYHFWISDRGEVAILLYDRTEETYEYLVDWVETDAVIPGETNILQAVCVDEYLALYVNGQFIIETVDVTYETGVAGLVLRNFDNSEDARAEFDDLYVWTLDD